jgi:ketosteroid isomerase-like protein
MTSIETINQFYQAIIDKNIAQICDAYVQDEQTYVVLEGPRLTTLGFSKIEKGWIDFSASTIALTRIEWLEGPFSEEEKTMAWVGGVIKLVVSIGDKPFEQTFRASFVLKKGKNMVRTLHQAKSMTEGVLKNSKHRWLIRHEHVSGALADPYGIGDWLKK